MEDAFIFDHVRTPRGRGKSSGSLYEVTPIALLAGTLKQLQSRNHLDTALIEDVGIGCGSPLLEQGPNVARAAALSAGYGERIPGFHVERFCGSGLEAVAAIAAKVRTGTIDLGVAGGVESMSRVPMSAASSAMSMDPQVIRDTKFMHQGVAADLVASKFGFDRVACDTFAVESHRRAAHAWSDGRFERSVVPVADRNGAMILAHDEAVRPDTSLEALGALKPSFKVIAERAGFGAAALNGCSSVERLHHVHHAGNSSGVVDGAASILMGSRDGGTAAGLRPRGRIVGYAAVGADPTMVFEGTIPATQRVLARAGMSLADIDLFEINEAFAVVPLRYMQGLDLDPAKVNVNGGAIAMGHPIGATGAILVGTILDELERRDLSTGLVCICVATGMGVAAIVQRV